MANNNKYGFLDLISKDSFFNILVSEFQQASKYVPKVIIFCMHCTFLFMKRRKFGCNCKNIFLLFQENFKSN
jgi:hypothetical protein